VTLTVPNPTHARPAAAPAGDAGEEPAGRADRRELTSFARVTMLSATLLSSLAFGSVVSIRSCSSSCETIVLCALPGQTSMEQT